MRIKTLDEYKIEKEKFEKNPDNFWEEKASNFNLDLKDSVMASDAFFPFPDCVELAKKSGISSVIQPGGSIKDNLSIEFCDENNISMVMTGTRHFKH